MQVDIKEDKKRPGYFTVIPRHSIDSDTHSVFREWLLPILRKSTRGIIVDLKNVDYISSAGLGVFFAIKKFMDENKSELIFCHLKPQIQKLFDAVKVLPKETIFSSLEEADRYFYRIMEEEIKKNSGEKTRPEKS